MPRVGRQGWRASNLKVNPADLTVLAKNNGGKFPVERASKFISGDEVVAAHGTREMPVWGPIFHQVEEDQDFGNICLQKSGEIFGNDPAKIAVAFALPHAKRSVVHFWRSDRLDASFSP